ncbi:MAG TPA: fibronectin type III domain-containing protein [Patescibacteria group bacterium]|nr:fibronectin type III domain-containing protein [Patescibacteria group bacterium]
MKKIPMLGFIGITLFSLAFLWPDHLIAATLDDGCEHDPVFVLDTYGTMNSNANAYVRPCMVQSKTAGGAHIGDQLHILAQTSGWYEVQWGNSTAWIQSSALDPNGAWDFKQWANANPWTDRVVGLTDDKIESLQHGDSWLIQQLRGRVVLAVQSYGDAYYVNPSDGLLLPLQTSSDIETLINASAFGYAEPTMTLAASQNGKTVSLNWNLQNATALEGYRIVMAQTVNPEFPVNAYHSIGTGRQSDTWTLNTGTYYFRVCRFHDGLCDIYSSNVAVTIGKTIVPVQKKASISLSGSMLTDGGVRLHWVLNNFASPKSFKIAASQSQNPVIQTNDTQSISDPKTQDFTWTGLTPGKTYYFRVCAFDGTRCTLYSNNETVTVTSAETGSAPEPPSGYVFSNDMRLSAVIRGTNVSLSWSPRDSAEFQSYKIVRSEVNSDPSYPNDPQIATISDQAITGYTDSTAQKGKTYYYRICSKESSGSVACGNTLKIPIE